MSRKPRLPSEVGRGFCAFGRDAHPPGAGFCTDLFRGAVSYPRQAPWTGLPSFGLWEDDVADPNERFVAQNLGLSHDVGVLLVEGCLAAVQMLPFGIGPGEKVSIWSWRRAPLLKLVSHSKSVS